MIPGLKVICGVNLFFLFSAPRGFSVFTFLLKSLLPVLNGECGTAYRYLHPWLYQSKWTEYKRLKMLVNYSIKACNEDWYPRAYAGIMKETCYHIKGRKTWLREQKWLLMHGGTDPLRATNYDDCRICKNDLGANRVNDHCHLTGKFWRAGHSACNLNFRFTGRITISVAMTIPSHYARHGKVEEIVSTRPLTTLI